MSRTIPITGRPGHGEKISIRREKSMVAVLTAAMVKELDSQAGLRGRTIRSKRGQDPSTARSAADRPQLLHGAVGDLTSATTAAVQTLNDNLQAERSGDQIRAAVAILDHAQRGVELMDVVSRVEELERLLADLQKEKDHAPQEPPH